MIGIPRVHGVVRAQRSRLIEPRLINVTRNDSGALSHEQVSNLLGMSFWETETFLKQQGAYLAYNAADLEEDRATLKRILRHQ